VPREVVHWALRNAGVEEWLVGVVMGMFEGASTAVKTEEGLSDWFDVKVGLHQGSAWLSWEQLYVDDLVLMADDEIELKKKNGELERYPGRKGIEGEPGKDKGDVGRGSSTVRE
jgi:hypothetical protein